MTNSKYNQIGLSLHGVVISSPKEPFLSDVMFNNVIPCLNAIIREAYQEWWNFLNVSLALSDNFYIYPYNENNLKVEKLNINTKLQLSSHTEV